MSLAPASSLGAFLKARFAVKGIQWAARSFGTLTAAGRGLLSSMGASCVLGCGSYRASYQLRCDTGTSPGLFFRSIGGLRRRRAASSQIGSADPEHFAVGVLGIQP